MSERRYALSETSPSTAANTELHIHTPRHRCSLAKSSKGLGTSTSTSRTLSNAKRRPGAYRMPKPSAMGALECSRYLVSAWKHFEMQWWRPYCTWYPQCDRNCQVMLRTGGTKKKQSLISTIQSQRQKHSTHVKASFMKQWT